MNEWQDLASLSDGRLRPGLSLRREGSSWSAVWKGKTLLLPDRPEGVLAQEFLSWATALEAAEVSRIPWFMNEERVAARLASDLEAAIRAEGQSLGNEAPVLESLFEISVFASVAAAVGRANLLRPRPLAGRTPLQAWGAAFYALCGPRRVSLERVGLDGRGKGGSLFDPRYLEEWWRLGRRPLPISGGFFSEVHGILSAFGWAGEGDEREGLISATLSAMARLGEELQLGKDGPFSLHAQAPIPVDAGFGGGLVDLAREGRPGFTAICRTRAEWTCCRARIWAVWPQSRLPLDLERVVHLGPPLDRWPGQEGPRLEFKAGYEWDPRLRRVNGDLRLSVVRAIAGMLNHQGGEVILGVTDQGEQVGLGPELSRSRARNPMDSLEQKLRQELRNRLRPFPVGLVHWEPQDLSKRGVVKITVERAPAPVEMVERDPATGEERMSLYVRDGNRTLRLSESEKESWMIRRGPTEWGQETYPSFPEKK
jgi:hypothetical protein